MFTHDNDNDNDILFVTAYKDINRESWQNYCLTNNYYIERFVRLATNIEYKLIVYIEDSMMDILTQYTFKPNIIFRKFDEVNTFFNNYLDQDKKIMASEIYKSKIPPHRKINPEHIYSEYNLINHSKINFVRHSKTIYPNYRFYSWIDFGFARETTTIPKNIKFSMIPEKIIYQVLKIPEYVIDPNTMLSLDDIFFAGSSFIVYHSLVEYMEVLYEKKIQEFQRNYISDDDQNLVLQIFYENKDLFTFVVNSNWHTLYDMIMIQN